MMKKARVFHDDAYPREKKKSIIKARSLDDI